MSAITPTWPTGSATWPPAPWPCSRSTAAGRCPGPLAPTPLDQSGTEAATRFAGAMDRYDLRAGAEAITFLVTQANQYIVQTTPWTLAKEHRDAELDSVLGSLARCLYRLAAMLGPFMPGKAAVLWQALGRTEPLGAATWEDILEPRQEGDQASRPPVLFPKPEPSP